MCYGAFYSLISYGKNSAGFFSFICMPLWETWDDFAGNTRHTAEPQTTVQVTSHCTTRSLRRFLAAPDGASSPMVWIITDYLPLDYCHATRITKSIPLHLCCSLRTSVGTLRRGRAYKRRKPVTNRQRMLHYKQIHQPLIKRSMI